MSRPGSQRLERAVPEDPADDGGVEQQRALGCGERVEPGGDHAADVRRQLGAPPAARSARAASSSMKSGLPSAVVARRAASRSSASRASRSTRRASVSSVDSGSSGSAVAEQPAAPDGRSRRAPGARSPGGATGTSAARGELLEQVEQAVSAQWTSSKTSRVGWRAASASTKRRAARKRRLRRAPPPRPEADQRARCDDLRGVVGRDVAHQLLGGHFLGRRCRRCPPAVSRAREGAVGGGVAVGSGPPA